MLRDKVYYSTHGRRPWSSEKADKIQTYVNVLRYKSYYRWNLLELKCLVGLLSIEGDVEMWEGVHSISNAILQEYMVLLLSCLLSSVCIHQTIAYVKKIKYLGICRGQPTCPPEWRSRVGTGTGGRTGGSYLSSELSSALLNWLAESSKQFCYCRIVNDQSSSCLLKCDRRSVQQRITISHYNKGEIDADISFKIEKANCFYLTL